ncbi:MAG: FAD-dependent oxidoreductase [Candidatus Accumulibacter meliphilus]|uniref:FAD-dependent oxidoreductase n=1 Tax=Candidatus Accumulibacter meliphilus TaxID=2211374 RepID=A0A369XUK7_9PROT|nr:MAG: FAD-dependent oxidoreductase [Candidatus Accumulibacter meliphilus]
MLSTYVYPHFDYLTPAELHGGARRRHPVIVVGAGPVGLATAIDLAQQGMPVLLLDDDASVSVGSRGVCYAKRTLEVLDRLGVGDRCFAKGVSWNVGRTFFREHEVYNFQLLSQPDHKRPGMINLQQYYLEEFLVRRAQELPGIDLRWQNRVVGVQQEGQDGEGGVTLQVETPDGVYALACDWLIVADGARSSIRRMLKLEVEGKVFMDRFLIADVVMKADFPAERWFWFDPPFHPGQSVLLHRQADNVWRIDFQLGWQADPDEEQKPEKVMPRIKAMLGEDREFELEWVSVYTFQCRRMSSFRQQRVLFVGDAAHQVSPFGARGANSGIQDADNLVWKLKLVIDGQAPDSLLDSYGEEREFAADENLLNSTRSSDFISPKSKTSLSFRNAVLTLARKYPFARALVNSGRLSVPAFLCGSSLNTHDGEAFNGQMWPGAAMDDAPIREQGRDGWLLDAVGEHFMLLCSVDDPAAVNASTMAVFSALAAAPVPVEAVLLASGGGAAGAGLRVFEDCRGRYAERYDARPGTVYLLRPDQHIAARWRRLDAAAVAAALTRAIGKH